MIERALVQSGNAPIGGREDDGPEIGGGAIKFEGDVVKLHARLFDADDAAAHFHAVFGIAEEERLADMKMSFELEEATVGIDDLGETLLLDLVPLFVFREDRDGHTKHDAFASPPILTVRHRTESLWNSLLERWGV